MSIFPLFFFLLVRPHRADDWRIRGQSVVGLSSLKKHPRGADNAESKAEKGEMMEDEDVFVVIGEHCDILGLYYFMPSDQTPVKKKTQISIPETWLMSWLT